MKNINNKYIFKVTIWFLVFIILLEIISIIFKSNINELRNEYIDNYNFWQLEKVKDVLDKLDKNSYKIDDIKDFNKQFNQDIKPIKNCYFLSDRNWYFKNNNWGGGYIFWFMLYSNKYIKNYWTLYYSYPKYNLPENKICTWFGNMWWKCQDRVRERFESTISNPCRD